MADGLFTLPISGRSASATSSLVFEDMSKLLNVTPPWMSKPVRGKENVLVSDTHKESPDPGRPAFKQGAMMRSKSHPKISGRIFIVHRHQSDANHALASQPTYQRRNACLSRRCRLSRPRHPSPRQLRFPKRTQFHFRLSSEMLFRMTRRRHLESSMI